MNRPKSEAMPALRALQAEYERVRPFHGSGVLLHMHLTQETVELGRTFSAGGAKVVYLPSNRQPAAAEVLREAVTHGSVFDSPERIELLTGCLQNSSGFYVVEGNGRFVSAVHAPFEADWPFLRAIRGVSEHTSGGGRIVDGLDPSCVRIPIAAVYRCRLKRDLETGWGTAQSVTAALLRGLGRPIAGRRVGIIGFGAVGRGIARSVRTMGGHVTIADRSKEALLIARLQGFRVASIPDILAVSDVCLTATGSARVVTVDDLERCKEGIILANVSNKSNEIDLADCERLGEHARHLSQWRAPGGARFFVLGGGLQVNHVLEDGNPAELMDISFALHAVVIRWLIEENIQPGVYSIPDVLLEEVAAYAFEGAAQDAQT